MNANSNGKKRSAPNQTNASKAEIGKEKFAFDKVAFVTK